MNDPRAVFDEFAADYDEVFATALAITGDSREYYATNRVRWIASKLGAQTVASILDYVCGTGETCGLLARLFQPEHVVGY